MSTKLGVYLSENFLKVVEIEAGNSLTVKTAKSFALNISNFFGSWSLEEEKSIEQTASGIQKELALLKLAESEVNIVIPDELCSLQIIKLPLVTDKEIISAIELQAEEFVPYPIEKATFDYQILSVDKTNNVMFLLLVVALKELIDKTANFLLNLGFYPIGLESETTALIRLILNHQLKFSDKYSLLVNIGKTFTQIAILNNTLKQLVTTNSMNIGNQFFYKTLQNNLNVPLEEAKQIFQSLKKTDLAYQKVLQPIFPEYANQIQKILVAALEKIGTLPSRIYVNSSMGGATYSSLFQDFPTLQQYEVVSLNNLSQSALNVKFPNELQSQLGSYMVPLGALI